VSALPGSIDFPRIQEIAVDGGVLLFALFVTALTAIVFGLLPAWMSAQSASPARGSSHGRSYGRSSAALMVSEIAVAVTLLVGAGLLGRSLWNLRHVQPGFDPANVITMRTTLPEAGYTTHGRLRAFSRELLERVGSVPGIQAAGFANYLPLGRFGGGGPFEIDGGERAFSWVSIVGGEYFKAMGIPLLRGRFPDERDTELTQPVVVVDQALAERYWYGKSPVGTRVSWRVGDERVSGEVVGMVGNVRWAGVANSPHATMYFWYPQRPVRELAIVARSSQELAALANDIAGIVREIDPRQPVADVRPMQDLVSADMAQPRFTTVVLFGFAAVALLLSAIGLYGVIAYNTAQRTREVGIRLALGAERSDVVMLVLQRGLMLTTVGLAAGIVGSFAVGRLMSGLLFGVASADVPIFAAVTVLLTSIAFVASYVPARRAARVDPLVALRYE
jgi:putative ABC transport system permease protein